MFSYKIDNAHRAYAQFNWPTHIISLVGPDLNFDLPLQHSNHFLRVFHDFEGHVDPKTLEGSAWDLNGDPLILPTKEVLAEVLEFSAKLKDDDRLLIHCHAGRSRSASALIAILVQHGLSPQEAIQQVHATRPTMIPNRLMTKYFDELLGQDGALVAAVKQYWDNCTLPGVLLRTQLSGWVDENS